MSATQVEQPQISTTERVSRMSRQVQQLHTRNNIAVGIIIALTSIVALIFLSVIVYLLLQGLAFLINPSFYSPDPADVATSIAPELFNTFYILILTEILLVPIALAAAIYLVEYVKPGPFLTVIHFAAETLAGIPAIVLGLFGFIAFAVTLGLHYSRAAGALTLICLNLPLALRLFEDALASVPRELREGSLALGSSKWHMIRTVVLPSALPGIVTGIILTAGKIIGEAAALIYTMGVNNPSNVFTLNPLIASDTLTIHLWYVRTNGAGTIPGLTEAKANVVAAGSAALLMVILLVINLAARGLGRYIQRRVTAA